jgi:hypothetical protein
MEYPSSILIAVSLLAGLLGATGCSTVGTAAERTGDVVGEAARGAGNVAGDAVDHTGEAIQDTSEEAEEEID